MPEHDVFRDGKVHVMAEQCWTCIFRPGNLMRLNSGRVREMVDEANEEQGAIVCHSTLQAGVGNAVCKGYFDRNHGVNRTLLMARAMGVIEWQDCPPKA
jgi:hypothetical protein